MKRRTFLKAAVAIAVVAVLPQTTDVSPVDVDLSQMVREVEVALQDHVAQHGLAPYTWNLGILTPDQMGTTYYTDDGGETWVEMGLSRFSFDESGSLWIGVEP